MYLLKSDVGIDRGPDLEPEGPGIGAIQRERCVQPRTVGPGKKESCVNGDFKGIMTGNQRQKS